MSPEAREKRLQRDRRYYHKHRSDPGFLDKRRIKKAEYDTKRIYVRFGGKPYSYPVDPEKKEAILQKISEFRTQQRTEYKEAVENGWNY
jgi:hypothetical protein